MDNIDLIMKIWFTFVAISCVGGMVTAILTLNSYWLFGAAPALLTAVCGLIYTIWKE